MLLRGFNISAVLEVCLSNLGMRLQQSYSPVERNYHEIIDAKFQKFLQGFGSSTESLSRLC